MSGLKVTSTTIPDVRLIQLKEFGDPRGMFCETYKRSAMTEIGLPDEFVQDNTSRSARAGTVRGLHFQLAPSAQAKLVRVVRGAIFDVVVDLRRESRTFGKHTRVELREGDRQLLYVPVGFAHGFCTLMDSTEVFYKVSAEYDASRDRGLLWNDPALEIPWPVRAEDAVLSDKDRTHPRLAELESLF